MNDIARNAEQDWPRLRLAGFDGIVVTFADRLTDPANRAALAFRAALEGAALPGVLECSTSLVSTYLRFDPLEVPPEAMLAALRALLDEQDWTDAPLPEGRTLWRIPTAFGGTAGPKLDEAAEAAGLTPDEAIADLTAARVRVQTIGFAPGMPYLGELAPHWDIPRQTSLTAAVPVGGLCVAIRQMVLFPVSTPTGWRQVGRTALRLFQPDAETPFLLNPGDEICFERVSEADLAKLETAPNGGTRSEALP